MIFSDYMLTRDEFLQQLSPAERERERERAAFPVIMQGLNGMP